MYIHHLVILANSPLQIMLLSVDLDEDVIDEFEVKQTISGQSPLLYFLEFAHWESLVKIGLFRAIQSQIDKEGLTVRLFPWGGQQAPAQSFA